MSLISLLSDKAYGLAGVYTDNTDTIYSSPSIYGPSTPNSDIIQQPYIWVEPGGNILTDLNSTPLVGGLIDNITNLVTDETRIGKFLLSTKGLAFLATQALLQGQNPFNETSLYDPTSIPVTIATDATMGAVEAPTRFIPVDDLLPGPAGTLTAALPSSNLDESSGLQRARTAANAYTNFLTKYGGTVSPTTLLTQIANSLVPNLAPIGTQDGTYKVGDDTIYPTMLANLIKSTSLFGYYDNDGNLINAVQNYTNGSANGSSINLNISIASSAPTSTADSTLSAGTITSPDGTYTGAVSSTENQSIIANIWQSWSTNQGQNGLPSANFGNQNINSSVSSINTELQSMLSNISTATPATLAAYTPIANLASTVLSGGASTGLSGATSAVSTLLGDSTSLSGGSTSKLFPSYASGPNRVGIDKYNSLPLSQTSFTKSNTNAQFNTSGVSALNDLIQFYFTDLYNGIFIPFRATLTSLEFDNSAKWTPVNYIGRADRLFVYEGFEKNMTFGFKVYANAPEELLPMWQRVNYLVSLLSPAGYTQASQIASDFIVPPFVKLTIGDLCKNQPVVLNSVGVSIPEEASWELTVDGSSYSFLNGLIQRSGAQVAQVPMLCEISVNVSLLEKTAPAAGVNQFGDASTGGPFSQGLAKNNGTTINGQPIVSSGGASSEILGLTNSVGSIPGVSSLSSLTSGVNQIASIANTSIPSVTTIESQATQFLQAI